MSVKTPQEQLQNLLKEYLAGLYKTAENEEIEMTIHHKNKDISVESTEDTKDTKVSNLRL